MLVVFTGLGCSPGGHHRVRAQWAGLAEDVGFRVGKRVGVGTDYLVSDNSRAGRRKLAEAQRYRTEIISYARFWALCRRANPDVRFRPRNPLGIDRPPRHHMSRSSLDIARDNDAPAQRQLVRDRANMERERLQDARMVRERTAEEVRQRNNERGMERQRGMMAADYDARREAARNRRVEGPSLYVNEVVSAQSDVKPRVTAMGVRCRRALDL